MTGRTGLGAEESLRAARERFGRAGAPALGMLLGRHHARFVGPGWWRGVAPAVTAAMGMPRWWGKRFWQSGSEGVLDGENLLLRDGVLVASFPMRARLGPSRADGLPALVVTYPEPAPWQWRRVTDELRPVGEHTLAGLTFSVPALVPRGLPFRLDRVPDVDVS